MSPTKEMLTKERNKILEQAEKYAKRGKIQEAIAEYRKLLKGDTQEVNVRNIISNLYLRSNQKRKALEEFYNIASYYEERGLYSQSMAVYKKICKLSPGDTDAAMKLADLYSSQGFLSEAKAEYSKIARELVRNNRVKKAIFLYEKLKKLDRKDIQTKLSLADLYTRVGSVDQAIEELNDIAEMNIRKKALKEAREALNRAKKLKEDHPRTLSNLIDLLKKEDGKKEALDLIDGILKKDKDNVRALKQMGNLYFDDQNFKKAEEIFSKVISLRPKDMEAIVKIGHINILQDNLNQAYELYEPLVDTLIKKQKVEKAIGLLGLILSSEKVHIPSLEGLASIYKSNNQKKHLEIVYRIILEEYHKKKLRKESLSVLSELVKLCPDDDEVKNEYNLLRKEIGLPKEEKEAELSSEEPEEVEELPVEPKKAEVPVSEERETEVHLEEEKGVELPPEEPKEAEEPLGEETKTEVEELLMEEPETEVHEVPLEEKKGVELPPEEPKEAEEPLGEETKTEVEELLMEEPETEVHEVQLEEEKEVELPLKEQREAEESLKEPKEAEEPLGEETKTEVEELLMEEPETEVHEVPIEEKKGVELPPEEPKEAEELLKEEKEPKVRLEEEREVGKPITEEKELEVPLVEKKKADGRLELLEGTEERLEMSLAQADLYLEQGLLRNARRILENLRLSYPDDSRIDEKIASISKLSSQAKVEEILQRVEKVSEQETQLFGKKAYFRFNLGIAFLEQGLIDEAVEEFKLASKDKSRAVECYTVISNCYRQKKDFQEATKWVEKALKLSKAGSDWFYALKYELASLYEELKEANKALALYAEIKKWNSEYKDVVNKIKILEKKLQK